MKRYFLFLLAGILLFGHLPVHADIFYVAFYGANKVERFDSSGNDLGIFAFSGSPAAVAFDAVGNLYVANRLAGLIERFAPTGTDLGVFASASNPFGLAFDPTGNLFVSKFFNNVVEKFSPTGTDLGTFGHALLRPNGIA